jgi:hypothetical protein
MPPTTQAIPATAEWFWAAGNAVEVDIYSLGKRRFLPPCEGKGERRA